MLQTLTSHADASQNYSQQPGMALAVRNIDSGTHRLPHIRPVQGAANGSGGELSNSELAAVAADVANAVGQATLQYRENNSWVQLELDLWKAMTSTIEKWRRRSPAPATWPLQPTVAPGVSRRVAGPVRFQLRHR